jgi:MFS transporter, YNFM family, putative membrane transport protein
MGGVFGDLFGWRNVFFAFGGMFALAAAGLAIELIADPRARGIASAGIGTRFRHRLRRCPFQAFRAHDYHRGLHRRCAGWGAFAYIGADLHLRFGVSFTFIGLTVGFFGVGGLIYAALVKLFVRRLGQARLAVVGGFVLAVAYAALAIEAAWWLAPVAVTAIGLGFYMFHNTLQTKATQMTPEARGTAVAIFSSALYIGQTAGVAIGALVIDRLGAVPLFVGTAVAFPLLALWFARELQRPGATRVKPECEAGRHTLANGTFGTEPRPSGVLPPGPPDGLRRGVRDFLARRGSGSFSGRGFTGPSG